MEIGSFATEEGFLAFGTLRISASERVDKLRFERLRRGFAIPRLKNG
jgi:hypothetical protein